MDSHGNNKVHQPAVRKVKKKQGKDELDRLKQAEKKKRRLEKALATSAAIRSELEKKKQKKKEEQQRLDEEGAAIAEAVALHVLLGEDSEESQKILLNKYESSEPWDYSNHFDFVMGGKNTGSSYQGSPKCSIEGIGLFSGGHGFRWGGLESSNWSSPSVIHGGDLYAVNVDCVEEWRDEESSPGFIAAQAVSSLRIREDAHVDTIFVDRMQLKG